MITKTKKQEQMEKRSSPRLVLNNNNPVYLNLLNSPVMEMVKIHEISKGGMKIQLVRSFTEKKIGDVLKGVMKIPGEKAFLVFMEIVFIEMEAGLKMAGIRFVKIDKTEQKIIDNFVKARINTKLAV